MYDIIIKNGRVIDGSGQKPYIADVAISGGRIETVSREIKASAKNVIDAAGLTVTPGFIDSHSHSDLNFFSQPQQTEKVEQGITTSIGGQCGMSLYPKRRSNVSEGTIYQKYETVGDFISKNKTTPQGSNLALLIGHGQLREAVMGMENRKPTPKELEEMKALLREGIQKGALGISFGLIYTPSCYADTEELIELAKVAGEYKALVVAHIRNEADLFLEAVEEFLRVIKAANTRAVFSHHKAMFKNNHGKVEKSLQMISEAIAEGDDIYCDVYPYIASSTALEARFIPQQYRQGGEKLMEFLQDPELREKIKEQNLSKWGEDLSWVQINLCEGYPQYAGKNLNEISKVHGKDVYDTLFDMLVSSGGHCDATFFSMSEKDVERVMKFPRAMIGTDGGSSVGMEAYHPRLRGTFPRVLGRYVRERQVTSLEEMIRKITSLPACVYGLQTKGYIKAGYDADICIFDADKIIDRADYINCHNRAEGLSFVIIKGEIVAENAVHNQKTPAGIIV